MKIRPLADRIVVKRLASEERTRGGIVIPDTAKQNAFEGEVIAVGKGKLKGGKRRPPIVKIGDRVLFEKHAGSEVVIEGVRHLVLRDEDVLAVVGELPGKDDTDVK